MLCHSCKTDLDGEWEYLNESGNDSFRRIKCSSVYFFQQKSKSGRSEVILSMCFECWNHAVGLDSKNEEIKLKNEEIQLLKNQLTKKSIEFNEELKSTQEKLEEKHKKERIELEKSVIFDLSKFHKLMEMANFCIEINNLEYLKLAEELKKDFIQEVQEKINGKTQEIIEKFKFFCEKETIDYKKKIEKSMKIQDETITSMNNMNLDQETITETANAMSRGRNSLETKLKCLDEIKEKLNEI